MESSAPGVPGDFWLIPREVDPRKIEGLLAQAVGPAHWPCSPRLCQAAAGPGCASLSAGLCAGTLRLVVILQATNGKCPGDRAGTAP